MNCRTFTEHFDEYLEGSLPDAEHDAAAAHLRGCRSCRRRVARAQALRAALRRLPVPAARPEFFEQALARAQAARTARRPVWTYMVGAALAASLALWIGYGLLPNVSHAPAAKPLGVTIALHETRTVQLAFNAERELQQATLTITLPEGVELKGFPGQREVRWQTNLARGANVLSLPLVAVSASQGALLARLEHGDRSTELTVPLHVTDSGRSSALPATCGSGGQCQSVIRYKEATNAHA